MRSNRALAGLFVASGLGLAWLSACMPAPVKAVDDWLLAYERFDAETVAKNTCAKDRELARRGVEAVQTSATSTLAMIMPLHPIKHEINEIETKDDGRRIIITTLTLKNPLPFMSKKVGQVLPDMPKTRTLRQRFLVVQEGEHWGLKFDLELSQQRLQFAADFEKLLAQRKYSAAAEFLKNTPPRPDSGNSLRKSDRLKLGLQDRLAEILKRVKTSSASKPATP